jgi:hypothetical protein
MPHKPAPKSENPEQSKHFIETARTNAIPQQPSCFRYALVRFKRTPLVSTFLPSLRIWGRVGAAVTSPRVSCELRDGPRPRVAAHVRVVCRNADDRDASRS